MDFNMKKIDKPKMVAPGIEFNGLWYEVTAPDGETWTFEDEDMDLRYIDAAIDAWTMWRDYVTGRDR